MRPPAYFDEMFLSQQEFNSRRTRYRCFTNTVGVEVFSMVTRTVFSDHFDL